METYSVNDSDLKLIDLRIHWKEGSDSHGLAVLSLVFVFVFLPVGMSVRLSDPWNGSYRQL